jgi:hypothetical protein
MELDVLPNALAVPMTLTGIDTASREGYVDWLVQEFDVDPQLAQQILPEQVLGLVVATASGWTGRVWNDAPLNQQQQFLDQLCAHGVLGDLRGEVGDWWWFPRHSESLPVPQDGPLAPSFGTPELRVQAHLIDQLLAQEDATGLLAGENLNNIEACARRLKISFKAVLYWAARHTPQPLWIDDWANPAARALAWTPDLSPGISVVQTPQGWRTLERLIRSGLTVTLTRPTPRLRQLTGRRIEELLHAVVELDWITAEFEELVLPTLRPHLERLSARVILCLENPADLSAFFSRLFNYLEVCPLYDRQLLAKARTEKRLQVRLGIGLSPRYQIALFQDIAAEGMYYYSAPNQSIRTLGSWEGSISQYRQKFESLWHTAADNRIQVIDLADLFEKHGC